MFQECPRTLLSCEEFVRDSGYDFNSTRMSKRMCSNNSSMVTPQESIYTKCFSEGQAQVKDLWLGASHDLSQLTLFALHSVTLPTSQITH